jgi:23S rRNA (pseudouridine1915-N3)-methyltransferase
MSRYVWDNLNFMIIMLLLPNMITLHLVVLGRLNEQYWKEAEQEYLKRLTPFAKIILHELKEESFAEKDPVEFIKEKEAEKIKSTLEGVKGAFIVALDETGKEFSSVEFSEKLEQLKQSFSTLVFIVGGPLGLHASILELSQLKLSLSQLTFTHQMVRIFLLEQLYRSCMISAKKKYHY